MAGMRGDIDTMQPLIEAAERAFARDGDEPFAPTAGRAGSLLVNVPAVIALQRSYMAQLRGDPDGTRRTYQRVHWRTWATANSCWRPPSRGFWPRGRVATGPARRGRAGIRLQHHRMAQRRAADHDGLGVLLTRSRIQQALGRLDAAEQTCLQALECAAVPGGRPMPAARAALVGLAGVAYQRNDLSAALAHLDEGIALGRQFVHTPPLAAGLVTLAWIRHATGDPQGALDAIEEAQRFSVGPDGLFNPVPAQSAKLRLAQGDLEAAAQWTEDSGLSADRELAYPREIGHLVLARVLLAQDHPNRALPLLDQLHAAALNQRRTRKHRRDLCPSGLALAAIAATRNLRSTPSPRQWNPRQPARPYSTPSPTRNHPIQPGHEHLFW